MNWSKVRTARKTHRCSCGRWITPGDTYVAHSCTPHHDIHSNPGWWHVAECAECATRYGRLA